MSALPAFSVKSQEGDGLPDMCQPSAINSALKRSGFDILEARDMALDDNPGGVTWYYPLTPGWNILSQRFQFNWLGLRLTKAALYVMEMVRIVRSVSLARNLGKYFTGACRPSRSE